MHSYISGCFRAGRPDVGWMSIIQSIMFSLRTSNIILFIPTFSWFRLFLVCVLLSLLMQYVLHESLYFHHNHFCSDILYGVFGKQQKDNPSYLLTCTSKTPHSRWQLHVTLRAGNWSYNDRFLVLPLFALFFKYTENKLK